MKKVQNKQSAKRSKTGKVAIFNTAEDLKSAALIVSLLINLFVLSLWVTLQITSSYDSSLASFFIHR